MRSIWRTLDRETLRAISLVCLADAIVGASFGAITVSGGLPAWVPVVMSLLVFAGGAQFAAAAVMIAGGSPVAAVIAGLVLNARLLPYGFTVSDAIATQSHKSHKSHQSHQSSKQGQPSRPAQDPAQHPAQHPAQQPAQWWTRLLGAHVITDETVAFTMRQTDPRKRRAAFWVSGIGLFLCWNAAVALGVLAGKAMPNPDSFGLDAAFPAVVLALVLPSLKDRSTRNAALVGAALAVALTPVLPAGLPVLLSLASLILVIRPRTPKPVQAPAPAERVHVTEVR
ncbi:MAG TPA: AzlC family ABC transporter permease [Streptosporangiaceae bacterium]|nr:AzlC family ABC transporter permease [Streptosporangiaceae bacterium]